MVGGGEVRCEVGGRVCGVTLREGARWCDESRGVPAGVTETFLTLSLLSCLSMVSVKVVIGGRVAFSGVGVIGNDGALCESMLAI